MNHIACHLYTLIANQIMVLFGIVMIIVQTIESMTSGHAVSKGKPRFISLLSFYLMEPSNKKLGLGHLVHLQSRSAAN